MPSKPGNPGWPNGSVIGLPARSGSAVPAGWPVSNGLTCWAPNRPLNPAYPPGSAGSRSSWPDAQVAEPAAQWTLSPTKSVCALARAAVPGGAAAEATASFHCGEPAPKTLVMSPLGPVPVFSSTVLAVATAPKSHPARVNGTHGAGALTPVGVTMFGTVVVAVAGSVQYPNELGNENPAPLKRT